MQGRPPLNQMAPHELVIWLEQLKARFQAHIQWEQRYLERRARRGIATETDRTGNEGLVVEWEVLGLLDEMLGVARQQVERED